MYLAFDILKVKLVPVYPGPGIILFMMAPVSSVRCPVLLVDWINMGRARRLSASRKLDNASVTRINSYSFITLQIRMVIKVL